MGRSPSPLPCPLWRGRSSWTPLQKFLTLLTTVPLYFPSQKNRATTRRAHTPQRLANDSPSPGGEGRDEGEPTHSSCPDTICGCALVRGGVMYFPGAKIRHITSRFEFPANRLSEDRSTGRDKAGKVFVRETGQRGNKARQTDGLENPPQQVRPGVRCLPGRFTWLISGSGGFNRLRGHRPRRSVRRRRPRPFCQPRPDFARHRPHRAGLEFFRRAAALLISRFQLLRQDDDGNLFCGCLDYRPVDHPPPRPARGGDQIQPACGIRTSQPHAAEFSVARIAHTAGDDHQRHERAMHPRHTHPDATKARGGN